METAGKLTPMALCLDDAAQQLWVVDRQAPVFAFTGRQQRWAHHSRSWTKAAACPSESATDKLSTGSPCRDGPEGWEAGEWHEEGPEAPAYEQKCNISAGVRAGKNGGREQISTSC